MGDIIDLKTQALYFTEWKREAKAALDIACRNTNGAIQITDYKWKNIIAHYMMDLINFRDEEKDCYAGLLAFIAVSTRMNDEMINEIFAEIDIKLRNKDLISSKSEKPTQVTKLSVFNDKAEIEKLNLRYVTIGRDTGFFWSVLPSLYLMIQDISNDWGCDTVECFASPYNYTANKFCSPFDEDCKLKYPPGVECMGEFFNVITDLRTTMLLFNPPYTDRMIKASIKSLMEHLENNADSGFVALLPEWDFEPIMKLKEIEDVYVERLEPGTYTVHDFSKEGNNLVSPSNLSLLLFILPCSGMDKEKLINASKLLIINNS